MCSGQFVLSLPISFWFEISVSETQNLISKSIEFRVKNIKIQSDMFLQVQGYTDCPPSAVGIRTELEIDFYNFWICMSGSQKLISDGQNLPENKAERRSGQNQPVYLCSPWYSQLSSHSRAFQGPPHVCYQLTKTANPECQKLITDIS